MDGGGGSRIRLALRELEFWKLRKRVRAVYENSGIEGRGDDRRRTRPRMGSE